jgi:transposase-like protein
MFLTILSMTCCRLKADLRRGWLQKLRSVMIRAGRERLTGRVEVDEAYVGGQKEGARGRGAEGKTAVLVAVEGDPKKKLGRVRFRCVEAITRESVELFIGDYVEPDAMVVTDGLSVYDQLKAAGYDHHSHVITTGGKIARQELDPVHLVISLLKRWLGGTTKVPSRPLICRRISTNSLSVSTVASHITEASFSTDSCNKP